MIADMLPLLAFTSVVVIARNVFEAYLLDHARAQGRAAAPVDRLRQRAHAHVRTVRPHDHFS